MEDKINIITSSPTLYALLTGIEPHINKFKFRYGHLVDIEWADCCPTGKNTAQLQINPSDVQKHWDEKSVEYEMPIDGDLWSEDPLD